MFQLLLVTLIIQLFQIFDVENLKVMQKIMPSSLQTRTLIVYTGNVQKLQRPEIFGTIILQKSEVHICTTKKSNTVERFSDGKTIAVSQSILYLCIAVSQSILHLRLSISILKLLTLNLKPP